MKLARYIGNGQIAIVDEPAPACPVGGLLVKTEASGLCSGELMDWYMEKKVPHVLGHEVSGKVVESCDSRFPVGSRVFAHHHAACRQCEMCRQGLEVHCDRWRRTKLIPGGMAEYFAVPAENLTDTHVVDDLRPVDAALIEPLACVMKSTTLVAQASSRSFPVPSPDSSSKDVDDYMLEACATWAVIGLGVMGLMHLLVLPSATGYELNPERLEHARSLGLRAEHPSCFEPADTILVCPGSKAALDLAIRNIKPGGRILLFAPMPRGEETPVDLNTLYFKDVILLNSYSCGPRDTSRAIDIIRQGKLRAEQVVSDFIGIDELPAAYQRMKRGEILKPMVVFD
jgi:L-iditol 2-dehydrogenase